MKIHYVYKLTHIHTNEFYFGSRTTNNKALFDEYYGSGKWKPNKELLKKEIIKEDFTNKNSAVEFESNLISEHITNPLNRNYHIPNSGFHREGSAGMLFRDIKTLYTMAEKVGVEIKSKWGLDEQELIYELLQKEKTLNDKQRGFNITIAKCN